jgi:FAD dependent oxidoreductase
VLAEQSHFQGTQILDMLVIGGGINGVGIARDAAGCGLSVRLVEKGDLAAGTSSASSKLIHGGLRYLEHGAFRLVREALAEREVLLASAPHIIHPLPFVLPYAQGLRPWALLRLGLFLYPHLGGRRTLLGAQTVALRARPYGWPLQTHLTTGFVYSDCQVDDARLVVLNARDAAAHGAQISTRSEMRSARRNGLTGAFSPRRRVCDGSRGAHSRKCGGAVGLRSPAPRGPDRTQSRSSADQREPYRGSPPLQRRAGVHSAEPSRIGSAPDTLIRAGQRWSR